MYVATKKWKKNKESETQENKLKNKNKTRLSSFKKCIYLWEEGMNTLNFYSNLKKTAPLRPAHVRAHM